MIGSGSDKACRMEGFSAYCLQISLPTHKCRQMKDGVGGMTRRNPLPLDALPMWPKSLTLA
jgi:hypothetical protein